ncbi:MAG TPA: PIN domain-containing protein [Anaerovoracaceae bacterium]|nr:PIN domain-containing protein [Anaerovoracaceae bacterium]
MLRKILRIVFTLVGCLVGLVVYYLLSNWVDTALDGEEMFTQFESIGAAAIIIFIFGLIFFRLTPLLSRQGAKAANNIGEDLREISANDLIAGVIGFVTGIVIALLFSMIYRNAIDGAWYVLITVVLYIMFGYLGIVVATNKGKEIIGGAFSDVSSKHGNTEGLGIIGKSRNDGYPKVLDTSVIIDGRIVEILKTGFLEGPIVIPEFVLVELRHIADSSDSLKRTRGRRGLDILKKIQTDYGIEIYNTDKEKAINEIPEVDVKLLKLAQILGGKVVTNDYNLNKVAGINEVPVLNINELANTLKPIVLPGESMVVNLVKEGKDSKQAVAYLDDGTMIVVEDGKKRIGETAKIVVTSVFQTSAGRMIFGKLKTDEKQL